MTTKDEWRAIIRRRRRAAAVAETPQQRRRRDRRHVDGLVGLLATLGHGWVVTYDPLPGEVDLGELAGRSGIGPLALTRTPAAGHELTIHPFDAPRERHRFGFEQPTVDAPVVADDQIVAVLVPGLAFDRVGFRLGHGGGYYDRLCARLGGGVARIGVTGDTIVDTLPVEPHDVAMTHLAASSGVAAVEATSS